MSDALAVVAVVLMAVVAGMQIVLLRRRVTIDLTEIEECFAAVEKTQERLERNVREEIARNREESAGLARQSREELAASLKSVGDTLNHQLVNLTQANSQKLDTMREAVEQRLQRVQADSGQRLEQMRLQISSDAKQMRDETTATLKQFNESLGVQLGKLGESNEKRMEALRSGVEDKLKAIQQDNTAKLEQMRQTVDEKLQGTLEKRLGESFKLVSDRLEQVYKGLGEMQVLASGVGDLKKVLTNVKTRGTWGEVQLAALLEQVLTPEQYGTNIATKPGSNDRVEFAIRLPGRGDNHDEVVWLPIDAKFPVEDYQRLVEAQEAADPDAAEAASRQLETRIKQCAADICNKYISAPATTDFGILFLPTEGLFAEVVRRPGLADAVQRDCRVVIAGPTTLWSILNSLQMGFRTLAIQQRSSEVWKVLGAIKTEFGKYGDILAKVQKKLQEASNTIDDAQKRSRVIGRKLRDVQELPSGESQEVLLLGPADDGEHDEG
jgi:DNA recombination protein RmuC